MAEMLVWIQRQEKRQEWQWQIVRKGRLSGKGSCQKKAVIRKRRMNMEWVTALRQAVNYMEAHLMEDVNAADIAEEVHISSFYLQKGFKLVTGYSIGEYMRCRRLYLAALDVLTGRGKVIEIAYRYGYDTPESFTKAFTRFHGISPVQVRKNASAIRTFLPLKIIVTIQGGKEMDYVVEKKSSFQVIGLGREFPFDSSYEDLPKYWDEFKAKYGDVMCRRRKPQGAFEQAICDYNIGEYGICIDDLKKNQEGKLCYMIAGAYYAGGDVPEGMSVYTFPDMEWAKFRCYGKMPVALQDVNTKIFKEWLHGNPDYEMAMGANIEWYEAGDVNAMDYRSEIWIPVRQKA